jgi:hypothetical protein
MSLQDTIEDQPYVQAEAERAYWSARVALAGNTHVVDWELYYDEMEYAYCRKVKLELELACKDKDTIATVLRKLADAIDAA